MIYQIFFYRFLVNNLEHDSSFKGSCVCIVCSVLCIGTIIELISIEELSTSVHELLDLQKVSS